MHATKSNEAKSGGIYFPKACILLDVENRMSKAW